MPAFLDNLKVKFQTLPAETKRNIVLGGAVSGILIVAFGLVTAFSEEPKERKPPPRKSLMTS
jgi:hypothetical protein